VNNGAGFAQELTITITTAGQLEGYLLAVQDFNLGLGTSAYYFQF
jgi:hypothetical protein